MLVILLGCGGCGEDKRMMSMTMTMMTKVLLVSFMMILMFPSWICMIWQKSKETGTGVKGWRNFPHKFTLLFTLLSMMCEQKNQNYLHFSFLMRIRSKKTWTGGRRQEQACFLSSFQLRTEYSQLSKLGDGQ